jgi:hypothetical protein
MMISEVTNAPNAMQNSSAAAVTMRPVRSRPAATATEPRPDARQQN